MVKFNSSHFEPPYFSATNLAGLILLLYAPLLFLVRGGMNGSLFLLAIVSLAMLVVHRKSASQIFDKTILLFGIAMSSGMLVVLLSQIHHDDLSARYFDSNARFLLAAPILLALREMNPRTLSAIQYAFPLGALAALAMVFEAGGGLAGYAATSFVNHIHLGDMALSLGLLSVLSLNWQGKDPVPVQALKWAGLLAGLVVSVLSSARGGWVAIPLIVAVSIYARNRNKFFSKFALALLSIFLVILLGYLFVPSIHWRLWMIYSDLSEYGAGNADTSIGIRLQLWKAALHLIAEYPILGVGADGFGRAMDGLAATGFLTPLAAAYGKAEVHSELLAQMVRFGVPGLCFILAIYFVPFYLFAKALNTVHRLPKGAAVMGMSVTLGFFVFGLTVETFDLKMTAAFYSLTVAALLAIATNKYAGIGDANQESRPSEH
ncbi:MAG TPA: O-antigen ligase family protein [Gallionellaceae bacterium]